MEQAIHLNFFTFNNEAEYEAFLVELDFALVLTATKLEIRSDSQLIIDSMRVWSKWWAYGLLPRHGGKLPGKVGRVGH